MIEIALCSAKISAAWAYGSLEMLLERQPDVLFAYFPEISGEPVPVLVKIFSDIFLDALPDQMYGAGVTRTGHFETALAKFTFFLIFSGLKEKL